MRALIVLFVILSVLGCGKRKKGAAYKALDVAAGTSTTCAAMGDGTIRCWGELGDGDKPLPNFSGAIAVCAGSGYACARNASGVVCHGRNEKEFASARAVACEDAEPRIIDASGDFHRGAEVVHDAVRIASGSDSTCVVRSDGTLRCFGAPEIAVDLSRLHDAADVAVGGHHACVLRADETLSCWGKNDHGQIGDATRIDRNVPTLVSNLAGVKHVAAGSAHTCVHRGDDTIRCWGSDTHRQLGLGGAAGDMDVPTLVPGLYEAVGIAARADFTCARMTDGWIRCWGANDSGQLGDGTNSERAVPVPIRM